MDWLKVSIETTRAGIEPLTGRLYLLGVQGAEIEDGAELGTFLEENRRLWDYVDEAVQQKLEGAPRVNIYLPDSPAGRETLLAVREAASALRGLAPNGEYGSLAISLGSMKESDWAESWKQYFKPLPIGERVLVCPAWETVPKEDAGRTVFTVEPGMVFGTGAHESTRLCIEAAQRVLPEGESDGIRVLDLGCGSGILSIIALLLGAQSAVAVDIDPNAEAVANRNALRNGIDAARYHVLIGDLLGDAALREKLGGGFGLVFANIVADVLIALAPAIPGFLAPGGHLIASGIIAEREAEVTAAFEKQGLIMEHRDEEKGWVALTGRAGGTA